MDVKVRGKSFRFVDTHLEAFSAAVRALQAVEQAGLLADSPLPVVLVGDLNSEPTDAGGAYGILTGALGLRDAWVDVHGPAGGNTSGQTDDLNLPESSARSRPIGRRRCRVRRSVSGRPTTPGWWRPCTWPALTRPSADMAMWPAASRRGVPCAVVR